MSTDIAKTKEQTFDISMMTEDEKAELSTQIDSLIDRCAKNRQAVNRLVFESMAAITAGEEAEKQFSSKKGLKRFIAAITGKNKALQEKINENTSVAQYASQQILQKLSEQNVMSFELITAVNNKLNASLIATKEEFNSVYDYMARIVKTTRGELTAIQKQLEKVSKNVDLLNWRDSIEYQMFGDREYSELEPEEKMVCLARDFFEITGGMWSTTDLLLLKSAMKDVDLNPKDRTSYFGLIKKIHTNSELKDKLLGGRLIVSQPEPLYLTIMGGIKKSEAIDNEEHYLVETVKSMVGDADDAEIGENIAKNYLIQETGSNVDCDIENYDLLLELIYNIEQAELEGVIGEAEAEELDIPEEDFSKEIEGKTKEELVKLSYEYYCGNNMDKAWKMYEAAHDCDDNTEFKEITEAVFGDWEKVLILLKWGAENGLTLAEQLLGVCYGYGLGTDEDPKEAVKLFKKAAEKGNATAQWLLGKCYQNGTGTEKNPEEAVKWYKQSAEKGNINAQNCLGVCYQNGIGTEKNLEEAVKWYRKAAEQGLAEAQFSLGCCYEFGKGVEENPSEAVKWYKKAAEQDYDSACINLAVCYDTEKDYAEAVKWYRKAAERGDAEAQFSLGRYYDFGKGVEENPSEAVKWYKKAAEQNHDRAQFNLAICYQEGSGVEKNISEAIKWTRRAADQGLTIAQSNMGYFYQNGEGVKEDYAEAVKWYKKAAEQGFAGAQFNLAVCYDQGIGVEVDQMKAFNLLHEAVANGSEDAQDYLDEWEWRS